MLSSLSSLGRYHRIKYENADSTQPQTPENEAALYHRAMQASKSFNHASRLQPFLIRSILHRLPAGTASQRGQPPASDRSWPCARVVRRAKLPPLLTACHMAERIRGPVVLEVLRNFRPREAIPRTSLMTVSHNLDTILEKLYLKQDNRQRAFRINKRQEYC